MITLDCSEHIPLGLEAVIKFTTDIYNEFIRGKDIDFELSIDETQTTTKPEDHRFVAEALKKADIEIVSLAPRFCGEFQKGIDYIGDTSQFEKEFEVHASIANEYGYKISVHSGSDKFAIFPIVSKLTKGKYHLKTAGTNWLEAVRVIAVKEPNLYREMHKFALGNLNEAKKYYATTENTANIANIETVSDDKLPDYLEDIDARRVLHITYGLILNANSDDGSPLFKERIYALLHKHENAYFDALGKHIGRHLESLSI